MDQRLKRMLYLTEFDNTKDKKLIQEAVNNLFESKQTEQQATAILKKVGIDDGKIRVLINAFKQNDGSKNQVMIPTMAKAYLEVKDSGLREMLQLFSIASELITNNKITTPVISDAGYTVNNKTFDNYLRFAEFIHGLESMSKGHEEWKGKIDIETDEPPIWEGNNISIYDGNDVGKCIKYTGGALTGKGYGFCIGQPANTMWQSYRDSKTSTFYYIVDSNRDLSDPLHIVVFDNTQHGVELTDASNHTGNIAEFGSNVNGYIDYLKSKGAPVEKLVNKPKTPEEEKETEKLRTANKDLGWFKDLSYEEQSKYIGRGHLLSNDQFKYLWQFKNDKGGYHLLHQYLDTGQPIPEEQFNILVSE